MSTKQTEYEKIMGVQIGGSHYKNQKYQVVQLAAAIDMNGFQFSLVRYITRYKDKNGLENLYKCMHYIDLCKALEPRNKVVLTPETLDCINNFIHLNQLEPLVSAAVYFILALDNLYDIRLRSIIHKLIKIYEDNAPVAAKIPEAPNNDVETNI